jgi:hypothetical protein
LNDEDIKELRDLGAEVVSLEFDNDKNMESIFANVKKLCIMGRLGYHKKLPLTSIFAANCHCPNPTLLPKLIYC